VGFYHSFKYLDNFQNHSVQLNNNHNNNNNNNKASHAWLKKSNIHPETEGFIFAIQDRVINTRNYKKNTYAVCNRSLINVGFAELKGKQLNTSFLLAPFWLKETS
jgi:hypothetical protein